MKEKDCNHCWHAHEGPYMMVLRDGHILQKCCKCQGTRTVHRAHAND
jgi:hypothetical protein